MRIVLLIAVQNSDVTGALHKAENQRAENQKAENQKAENQKAEKE